MKKLYLFVSVVVAAVVLLTACATPTPTPTPAPTAVPPTAVPPPAWGSADKPITMALAPSATTQELLASGDAIAQQLSQITGYTIKTNVPTSYAALIEAMGSGNAQIGWLPPLAYIVASQKGYADVGMAVLRNGSDHYGFQFIANVAQGFTVYYDPSKGKDTADAKTALAQFAGKKPCWTDPLSASGYVIPAGVLAAAGVKVLAGAWVQGHPTVATSVYLSPKGEICNFGATYVDARSAIAKNFPDVNDKVAIIWMSDAIIPNDNVSFSKDLPTDVRQKIIDALTQITTTDAGKAALKAVYNVDGLRAVDDTFYDDFRTYVTAMGFDISSYK